MVFCNSLDMSGMKRFVSNRFHKVVQKTAIIQDHETVAFSPHMREREREREREIMNPKFGMYGLHNLHHHPIGFQSFIFLLNWESVFEFLISLGTFLQILFLLFMRFSPGTMTTHAESINSDLQHGLDRHLRHTQH